MAQAVEEWYKQMPVITRSYLTAAIVTTIGCSLDVCTLLPLLHSLLYFSCSGGHLGLPVCSFEGLSFTLWFKAEDFKNALFVVYLNFDFDLLWICYGFINGLFCYPRLLPYR